jgi:hypothetical protein
MVDHEEDTAGIWEPSRPPARQAERGCVYDGLLGARFLRGTALLALALACVATAAWLVQTRSRGAAALQTGLEEAHAARTQQMASAQTRARALARVFVRNLERRIVGHGTAPGTAAPPGTHPSMLSRSAVALKHSEHLQTLRPKVHVPLQTLAGTARGRGGDGASGEAEGGGGEEDDEGMPGFEPPVGREPLSEDATGVDPGLRGEETSFIAAVDDGLYELGEDTGDDEVPVPTEPVKESATLRWLPFGRDELVEQAPTAQVTAHFNAASDETYTTFPDRIAPDSDQAAFEGTDVEVLQPPASARIEPPQDFIQNGTGAGGHWDAAFALQDFMDDDYVAQQSVAANPPPHRIHTDFDLQGLLPDVAVPGSEYLASLGEDSQPNGIVDNDLPVLAPVPSHPPTPEDAGLVPNTWGDVDVPADGARSNTPLTTKDLSAAAEDARAGNALGAAVHMGEYVTDLTHGDGQRRGVFGDNDVEAQPSDGAAAQIEQHAPLLAIFGRPNAGGGGGEQGGGTATTESK